MKGKIAMLYVDTKILCFKVKKWSGLGLTGLTVRAAPVLLQAHQSSAVECILHVWRSDYTIHSVYIVHRCRQTDRQTHRCTYIDTDR